MFPAASSNRAVIAGDLEQDADTHGAASDAGWNGRAFHNRRSGKLKTGSAPRLGPILVHAGH